MRQIKKDTWLQTFILGDVGVIWCNFLGDSFSQIYVMNFVEIVIAYNSHITSHVSQTFASCTHYISHSLLNYYMLLCVNLFWPSKIENSLFLMQNVFEVWESKDNWLKILFLGNLGLTSVFEEHFHLILMHFIHKILCFEEFLHKLALFFKKLCFLDFRSIESVSQSIKNAIKILVWIL